MKYEKLFSPMNIGKLTIKNRLVMPPIWVGYEDTNGEAGDRITAYYTERAKGGAGLIICNTDVSKGFGGAKLRLGIGHNDFVRRLELMTDSVHAYGTKIFAQVAPSAIAGAAVSSVPATPGAAVPRPFTKEELQNAISEVAEASAIAVKGGFDGIELHCAHGHIVGQFISKYYNTRTDEYGGADFENRMRFVDEILAAIRKAVGPKVPVLIRISGDDFAEDLNENFFTKEDAVAVANHLAERKLADAIDLSYSNNITCETNCEPYFFAPGWKKDTAKYIKERISLPTITTCVVKTPELAEELLAEDVCDFVSVGRGFIADPEFGEKAFTGREDEIRHCIGCLLCRETRLSLSRPVRCSVNPRAGAEFMYPEPACDGNGRCVAVVGAGPAGLEAAAVLAKRGFETHLFDKKACLGGTLQIAKKPAHKELLDDLIQTLSSEAEAAGVHIHLCTEASPAVLTEYGCEAVFVATGAKPVIPANITGIRAENVFTAEDVLTKEIKLSGKVAVVGSGMTGLETADLLSKDGCDVKVIEMLPTAGAGLYKDIRKGIMKEIKEDGIEVLTSCKLTAIEGKQLKAMNSEDGTELVLDADSVVLALGTAPDSQTVEAFTTCGLKAVVLGDANGGGRIYNAIHDGFTAAYAYK